MALTINKANATPAAAPAPVAEANPIPYLTPELSAQIMALDPATSAIFTAATELTPDLIEQAAQGLPESLLDELITAMEEYLAQSVPATTEVVPAPAVVAQAPAAKPDDRKAKRDALKAQIAANAGQGTVTVKQTEKPIVPASAAPDAPKGLAQPVVTNPAVMQQAPVSNLGLFDSLFPIGQQVTLVNRGGGKFELFIGKVAPAAAAPATKEAAPAKERKPKMASISSYLLTDSYTKFIEDLNASHPTLESRIALAESLGLKRGDAWANVTKDGAPMPPAIENMYMVDAIRKAQGIEQYVEGARTKEERKAILDGTAAWPTDAKPRNK